VTDNHASALLTLAGTDEIADAIAQAREACTALRWHEALRRRTAEAAAESRVRGARASALLEGADVPVRGVRDHLRGAFALAATDPGTAVARGAINATAAAEQITGLILKAPAQALVRLHTAAVADLVPAGSVGRPRLAGESADDLTAIGPAPEAAEAAARLRALSRALTADEQLPGVVLAALVHAELATARPFGYGNGVVARAAERAILIATGVDPTGVAVPEFGHSQNGTVAYHGSLAAYADGGIAGARLWLLHCAQAVIAGAGEGTRVADAVLAGRLG
jgi:Fic family protein